MREEMKYNLYILGWIDEKRKTHGCNHQTDWRPYLDYQIHTDKRIDITRQNMSFEGMVKKRPWAIEFEKEAIHLTDIVQWKEELIGKKGELVLVAEKKQPMKIELRIHPSNLEKGMDLLKLTEKLKQSNTNTFLQQKIKEWELVYRLGRDKQIPVLLDLIQKVVEIKTKPAEIILHHLNQIIQERLNQIEKFYKMAIQECPFESYILK